MSNHTYITLLPNELLIIIFSYLSDLSLLGSCSRVNHNWNSVLKSYLWSSPNISSHKQFALLAKSTSYLKQKNLVLKIILSCRLNEVSRNSPTLSSSLTLLLSSPAVSLTNLDISFCKGISNRCLIKLASQLKSLTFLNVSGTSKTDQTMEKILRNCTQLVHLNISWNLALTDTTLVHIGYYLPKLRVLNLSGLSRVTDLGIMSLSRSITTHIPFVPILSERFHSMSSFSTDPIKSTDQVDKKQSELELIYIAYCNMVSLYGLQQLRECCKRSLHISMNEMVE